VIRQGIHLAETEAEKQAVYRFRYDVYVEEMGRYGGAADHVNRLLVEPEDATARIFYARQTPARNLGVAGPMVPCPSRQSKIAGATSTPSGQ
jgi:hypothetical protein